MSVTKYGTKLTEGELWYRNKLIGESGDICCPITKDILSVNNGEILFINGSDYFVSSRGVEILMETFGEKYIEERIIRYEV